MDSEKDEKKEREAWPNDSPCCPQGESTEEGSPSCGCQDLQCTGKPHLIRVVKTLIFTVVMLTAIGVAAWSLLKKDRTEGMEQGEKQFEGNKTLQELCGTPLDSLNNLDEVAADKDFVFILMPGVKAEDTENAAGVIERTSQTLSRKGIRVGTFTIGRDNPDFKKVASSLGVDGFPAVLLMGKGCGANVVTGEITENKLLEGYVLASTPSACGPGPCR